MSDGEMNWSEWSKGADTGYFQDSNDGLAHVQVELDDGQVIEGWVQLLEHDDVCINNERIDMGRITRTRIQLFDGETGLQKPDAPRLIDAEDTVDYSHASSSPVLGEVEFDQDF